jgi:hypothetical protein
MDNGKWVFKHDNEYKLMSLKIKLLVIGPS